MENEKYLIEQFGFSEPFEGAEVSMTVTQYMEKILSDKFDLEIEFLQADRKKLPDGRSEIKFTLYDFDKALQLKELVLMMISQSHNKNMN